MKHHLRLLGDIHGKTDQYLRLIRKAEFTIQLGDFGFNYSCLKNVDPTKHKILAGNHDAIPLLEQTPHYLGNFGVLDIPDFGQIFFIRGAESIDKHFRIENVSWWQDEELSMAECDEALKQYSLIKPSFVISHDCPSSAKEFFFGYEKFSRTNQLLRAMFEVHQPEQWVFGHHHVSVNDNFYGTHFVCLPELGTLNF